MITVLGHLTIKTIAGRNGNFNVGRLATSIGEFVIKDAMLEQYQEGKYSGDFVIREIHSSYYTTGGRLVVEIRARLEAMTLDGVDGLTPEDTASLATVVADPLDEETSRLSAHGVPDTGSAEPDIIEAEQDASEVDEDAKLFGTIWPLGESVKLDSTVGRKQLRAQCVRLSQLGCQLDFKQQIWMQCQAA